MVEYGVAHKINSEDGESASTKGSWGGCLSVSFDRCKTGQSVTASTPTGVGVPGP